MKENTGENKGALTSLPVNRSAATATLVPIMNKETHKKSFQGETKVFGMGGSGLEGGRGG